MASILQEGKTLRHLVAVRGGPKYSSTQGRARCARPRVKPCDPVNYRRGVSGTSQAEFSVGIGTFSHVFCAPTQVYPVEKRHNPLRAAGQLDLTINHASSHAGPTTSRLPPPLAACEARHRRLHALICAADKLPYSM